MSGLKEETAEHLIFRSECLDGERTKALGFFRKGQTIPVSNFARKILCYGA